MADKSGVLDNSVATTQRLISSSSNTQIFSKATTGGDPGYSLDPSDTNDYFHLLLTQRSSLILTLNGLTGNADLALLDNNGDPLQTSSNGGLLAESIVSNSTLEAGDYYIRVYTPNNTTTVDQYTLNVSTIPTSRSDLLWRNYATGKNVVWQMNGLTNVSNISTTSVSDTNWKLESAGDMNGDGTPDYIWRNYATGSNTIWLMNGTAFSSSVNLSKVADPNWKIEGSADFDGDGKTDLVWRNPTTGKNVIWLMDGVTFRSSISLQDVTDPNFRIDAVGDFNQDGKPDLVWRNYSTGQDVIWVMNGSTFSYSVSLPTIPTSWYIAGAADFTNDGYLDLVWRNTSSGANIIWQMNGTSSVTTASITTVSDANWRIATTAVTAARVDLAGDTLATAFDIGTLNNTGLYTDKIGSSSDGNDYYKFKLSQGSTFNLSLTGLTANADVWLIWDVNNNGIYDSGDIRSISANLGTSNEQFQNQNLAAGNYFLRIFTPTSETNITAYQLSLGAAAGQPIDLVAGSTSSTFSISKTNGSALPTTSGTPTISLKTSSSSYVPAIKINYQVVNTSASYIPPQFTVKFYISRDNVISDASDRLLSQVNSSNTVIGDAIVTISNLGLNQTYSNSITVAVPDQNYDFWGGDQTYYIGMIVDADNNVPETNETNNTAATPLGIKDTNRPDMVGGGLSITQTTASPNQSIRISGRINNIGNVATSASSADIFYVRFYFSNDDFIDGSDYTFSGYLSVKTIAANSYATFDSNNTVSGSTFSITPLVLPDMNWDGWRGNGRYYIGMELNILNAVSESSGGQQNNSNYGRVIGQYLDYNYIDITGAPNYQP
ncbi:MAG: FG-GAP-like repeat-containing protein [Kovacikia sp.]